MDLRRMLPLLGLREYWYPAILDKQVGWRKPEMATLLGDVCFFRGASGKVVALNNACPHRGAKLSEGPLRLQRDAGLLLPPRQCWRR